VQAPHLAATVPPQIDVPDGVRFRLTHPAHRRNQECVGPPTARSRPQNPAAAVGPSDEACVRATLAPARNSTADAHPSPLLGASRGSRAAAGGDLSA
jgi:hypothetical protein